MKAAGTEPVLARTRPPAPGPTRPFHFPAVERGSLPNGFRLLVSPLRGLPVTTLAVILPAGAVAEAPRLAGLASLAAELLESGTARRDAAEIAEAAEALGVTISVRPRWDWVEIGITGLRTRLRPGAELLAELVRGPRFPSDEVARLRAERLATLAQTRAEPGGLADEAVLAAIYAPASPFSRPLDGVPESVAELKRGSLAAFHAARYRPLGSALIATGDLDAAEVASLAAELFGEWQGEAEPLAPVPVQAVAPGASQRLVGIAGAAQAEIRMGHVGVERSTPDYFPLLVMNAILGGTFSSRLNLNLRERHGFTYGVSSSWSMRRQPGPFLISTAVQTEHTGAAVREILREVEGMREAPPRPEELEDARNYLAGVFPLTLQTTDGLAARLAAMAGYGLEVDFYDRYRERILAVTGEEVLAVARRHLHPQRLATVVVGDAAALREQLPGAESADGAA